MNAGATGADVSSWKSNSDLPSIDRQDPKFLVIGEILRPHGLRGELRMRVLSDNPERLAELDAVYLGESPNDTTPERRALHGLRFNKEYALLRLEGCRSRNDAETLRDAKVMISMDQAAPLNDGEYFLFQLLGMKVVTEDFQVGTVKDVLQTGANDVYIVESDAYGEVLIPAHAETIVSIDFDAGVIRMVLPEGLLPTD
ncbi:MAG: ribosome maturation factor RimM [Chloroflexota bacterium]|nr:ribosome maturation factor RimM [Chloroflexota bacterium]MDE2947014.1 ribosome maturation factor RimM [Chloroflexota bacterium]